jgi:hypothetical protein
MCDLIMMGSSITISEEATPSVSDAPWNSWIGYSSGDPSSCFYPTHSVKLSSSRSTTKEPSGTAALSTGSTCLEEAGRTSLEASCCRTRAEGSCTSPGRLEGRTIEDNGGTCSEASGEEGCSS